MKIAIAGGTGFVGKALTTHFLNQGDTVYVLTRHNHHTSKHSNLHYIQWLNEHSQPENEVKDLDVMINLAGESINSGRWSEERKKRITQTRLYATEQVLEFLEKINQPPSLLINASAIGIYGTSLSETFVETSKFGTDFLAKTVTAWESHANKAQDLGMKVALMRFGIILDKEEGALPRMSLPYRLYMGGTVGSGHQWLSWIHIDDVVRSVQFVIDQQLSGPFNITSPSPMMMKDFGQLIGKVLGRPHWIPVPGIALKLLLGEMSMLVLEGQKVIPENLMKNGFSFKYEELEGALHTIFKR